MLHLFCLSPTMNYYFGGVLPIANKRVSLQRFCIT